MKKLSLVVLLSLAAFGCAKDKSKKSTDSETQAKKGDGEPGAAKATEGAKGADHAANQKKPMMMKATPTDADALGTVPEGYGLPVGDKAPDATVRDAAGAEVRLSDLYDKGHSLVIFYRGGWCPFCNSQIRSLTKGASGFAERKVTPILISVDSIDEANKTKGTYTIPFPVLSDPDLAAHEAFKVIENVSSEDYEKLKGMGMDLEKSSGRKHHKMAVPATFLVDSAGVVRWAHVDRDYKVRPTNEQLFAVIDAKLP